MVNYVDFQTVQKRHQISYLYRPTTQDRIITIVDNNPVALKAKYGLSAIKGWVNGFLEELYCYARITSLPDIRPPNYKQEDTDSDRLAKTLEYQWETARFELLVYSRPNSASEWVEFGTTALKHAGGHRYRRHRLIDLITDNIGAGIGEYGQIGVQIQPVGWGYPQTQDRITITGHWVQEFVAVQSQPPYAVVNNNVSSTGSVSPLPSPSPTPTPTPTPPAVTSVTVTPSTAKTIDDVDITVTVTGTANAVFDGYWSKGGTEISGTRRSIGIGTGGTATFTQKSSTFAASPYTKGGVYKFNVVESTTKTVSSGDLTIVHPSGSITPSTGYIFRKTAATLTFANLKPSTGYSAQWHKNGSAVTSTVTVSTDANGAISIPLDASAFRASPFNGTGRYKFVLTTTVGVVESNEIDVKEASITIPSGTFYLPGSGANYVNISNIEAGQYITSWLKDGGVVGSATTRTSTGVNASFEFLYSMFDQYGPGKYKARMTNPDGSLVYESNEMTMAQGSTGGGGSLT